MSRSVETTERVDDVVGRQLLCDCWDCQVDIGSEEIVLGVLRESVRRANVTLLQLFVHEFSPSGVSAVAIIAESHIIIHTWPEKRYAALDAFTCGPAGMPEHAIKTVVDAFLPKQFKTRVVLRRALHE